MNYSSIFFNFTRKIILMKVYVSMFRDYVFYLRIVPLFFLMALLSCGTEMDVDSEVGCIFENLDDGESFFVRFDAMDNSIANGRIYCITDALAMEARPITVSMRRNKCEAVVAGESRYTLKFYSKSDGKMEGWFVDKENGAKKRFALRRYEFEDGFLGTPNRYRDSMFEVERISDVNYANVRGFWSSMPDDTIDMAAVLKMSLFNSLAKKDLALDMDIYLPKGDTMANRPLMMFIHGGAFFIGDKATLPYQKWCVHFASLGYVCVSINYRMGFRPTSAAIERTAYQATQDAHAAMRYLMSKKGEYGINPDYLFVGGASAGGITAINLAYMRNKNRPESSYAAFLREDLGDLETSGNNVRNKFNVRAVANMWGAAYDLSILENARVPIISFHGDEDMILPYGYDYPFKAIGELQKVFFNKMYGSKYIHERALELGIRSELHTFSGHGHTLHLDENRDINENFYTIQNEIVDFFYEELTPNTANIIQSSTDAQMFMIDKTGVLSCDWNVVGGISIEESDGMIRASWFDDELLHELRVSGVYDNGATFEDVFVIKDVRLN